MKGLISVQEETQRRRGNIIFVLISLPFCEEQRESKLRRLDLLFPRKEVREQAKAHVHGHLSPVERTAGNWPTAQTAQDEYSLHLP